VFAPHPCPLPHGGEGEEEKQNFEFDNDLMRKKRKGKGIMVVTSSPHSLIICLLDGLDQTGQGVVYGGGNIKFLAFPDDCPDAMFSAVARQTSVTRF